MRTLHFLPAVLAIVQPAPSLAQTPGLRDVQMVRTGEALTLRLDFDQQPRSAAIRSAPGETVIAIDGVRLAPFSFQPENDPLFARIAAAPASESASALTLSGPSIRSPEITIYRNALIVSGIVEASAPSRRPQPAQTAADVTKKQPSASAAIALTPTSSANKPPASAATGGFDPVRPTARTLASLSEPICRSAAEAVALDDWNLNWLGAHALCLIDKGEMADGQNALKRLAMTDPSDWHAPVGRGLVALSGGDLSSARKEFAAAVRSAEDKALVQRLQAVVLKLGADEPRPSQSDHAPPIAISAQAQGASH